MSLIGDTQRLPSFVFGRDFRQKISSERQSSNIQKSDERVRSTRLTQNWPLCAGVFLQTTSVIGNYRIIFSKFICFFK